MTIRSDTQLASNSRHPVQHRQTRRFIFGLCLFGLLVGCGPSIEERIEYTRLKTGLALEQLKQDISRNRIRNATILNTYADYIARTRPELAQLARNLALDSSDKGPLYQGLTNRFDAAKKGREGFDDSMAVLEELRLIQMAANRDVYNDALSDPVNVLADLSNGQLARVNAISRAAEQSIDSSVRNSPGSQLVGNPNYGSWRTDSNGNSVWVWLAAYAFLSNSNFGRPWYYDDWSSRRGYSYYHDYGRRQYTRPRDFRRQSQLSEQTQKTYARRGKSFQSPYAKTRSGGAGISSASVRASGGGKFSSSYGRGSSTDRSASGYRGSTRSSSSRSRGFFGGK